MTAPNVEKIARSICKAKGDDPATPGLHPGSFHRWEDYRIFAEAAHEACFETAQFPGEPLSDYQKRVLADIPQLPQRQDSTNDQLKDLRAVANRLGMYDAAELIRVMLEDSRD